jgi:hypothetical protein
MPWAESSGLQPSWCNWHVPFGLGGARPKAFQNFGSEAKAGYFRNKARLFKQQQAPPLILPG